MWRQITGGPNAPVASHDDPRHCRPVGISGSQVRVQPRVLLGRIVNAVELRPEVYLGVVGHQVQGPNVAGPEQLVREVGPVVRHVVVYLVVPWRRQVRDCCNQRLYVLQKLLPAAPFLVMHVICEVATVQHRVKGSFAASAAVWLSAARVCHRCIQRRAALAVHHTSIAECKEMNRGRGRGGGSSEAVSGRPAVL